MHPLRCGPGPLRMPCSGLRQGRDLPHSGPSGEPLAVTSLADLSRPPPLPSWRRGGSDLPPTRGSLQPVLSGAPYRGSGGPLSPWPALSTWPSWVDLDFIPGFCTTMASFLRMGLWGVMLSSETPRTHGGRSSGCGCSRDKNRSTNHAELLSGSEAVLLVFRPLWLSSWWHGRVCSEAVRISWQALDPGPSQASPGSVALPASPGTVALLACSPLTSRLQTGLQQVRPGKLTRLVAASLLATSDLRWEALNQAVFRPKMSPRPPRWSVLVFAERH